jgi:DnaJ-related protein SCJ1
MPDGHDIVFEQEGDESPDTTPGDVIFKLKTLPNKRFLRRGDDLHTQMTISLLEALTGFSKIIKHLDGHEVVVKKSEVTKPGEVLTIEDEGMPHHQYPSQTGKLYVEFVFKMPESLTEDQKNSIKNILG